jgi:parvulin-like peptidyl-prolyl isomerase
MKKMNLLATVALSALLLCGCVNKNAIITVNGEAITKQQYETVFNAAAGNSMFSQMGIDLKKDSGSFLHLMLKDRVVNELIVKKLIDQEVNKRHIKISKEDMDKELKNIIDKVGSKEKFNELLKQNGVTTAQFKKDLEDEVKIKKLVDSLSVVSISDKEAKKFYNENIEKFKNPDKVRASHILVSANPEELKEKITADKKNLSAAEVDAAVKKEMAEKKAKAEKLLAEVKKNPSEFAKVAKENSDDTVSAKAGGDLGFFGKEEMVEPFAKAAFSMKPNTISPVVTSPYGYHIILVTDRQKAGVESFDSVKEQIKVFLDNQEKVKVLQQFVDTLKNNAKIQYNDPSFDPENIQKQLKEQAKNNPALMESQKSAKE